MHNVPLTSGYIRGQGQGDQARLSGELHVATLMIRVL